MSDKQVSYMYVIAPKKQKNVLIAELAASGAALIDHVYGKGYHENHNLFEFLGFSEEEGKVVISCLILREKGIALIETFNKKYSFEKAGSGIAFTVPVDKIVY